MFHTSDNGRYVQIGDHHTLGNSNHQLVGVVVVVAALMMSLNLKGEVFGTDDK